MNGPETLWFWPRFIVPERYVIWIQIKKYITTLLLCIAENFENISRTHNPKVQEQFLRCVLGLGGILENVFHAIRESVASFQWARAWHNLDSISTQSGVLNPPREALRGGAPAPFPDNFWLSSLDTTSISSFYFNKTIYGLLKTR